MPAVYAHNRFGNLVRKRLGGQTREIVEQYPALYQLGLQGPDFLFFYKPLKKNPVNQLGYRIHEEKASVFMERGVRIIKSRGIHSPEYAYLLGFICHFILDSRCHPYVSEEMALTGYGHIEIESEFEKLLLKRDGINPFTFPMGSLIPTGQETAYGAAVFYGDVGQRTVEQAINSMKLYKTLLASQGAAKRGMIRTVMKLSGHYGSLKGHLLNERDDPGYARSGKGLEERLNGSVSVASEALEDFYGTVSEGKALSPVFDCNFE